MRAGNIHLDIPPRSRSELCGFHDVCNLPAGLSPHRRCEPGLLYRRLREAKLFNHGDYAQASPSQSLFHKEHLWVPLS